MPQPQKENSTTRHKVLTGVGIALCVILIPLLIINVTLIIKSYIDPEEVPKLGGVAPLIVLTGSMDPTIKAGDLIFVKEVEASEVKVDDVIAFFDPASTQNSITTHRVKDIYQENGTICFTTWGDANGGAVDTKPVPAGKLVGIYKGTRIPGMGRVAMFMQTTAGLIVCVFVPLVLLIGWDIFRRRRHESRNNQDTQALLAELEALKAAQAAKAPEQTETPAAEADSFAEPETTNGQDEGTSDPQ